MAWKRQGRTRAEEGHGRSRAEVAGNMEHGTEDSCPCTTWLQLACASTECPSLSCAVPNHFRGRYLQAHGKTHRDGKFKLS